MLLGSLLSVLLGLRLNLLLLLMHHGSLLNHGLLLRKAVSEGYADLSVLRLQLSELLRIELWVSTCSKGHIHIGLVRPSLLHHLLLVSVLHHHLLLSCLIRLQSSRSVRKCLVYLWLLHDGSLRCQMR